MKLRPESHHRRVDPVKNFIAGGVGGIWLVAVGHPLDTIKVRLQTMPRPKQGEPPLYKGVVDCMKKTIRKEGFLSFYRGVGSMFVGVTPSSALSFFGNSIGRKIQTPANANGDYSLLQLFFAGSISAIPNAIVSIPVERVKCLLQTKELAKQNKNISSVEYKSSLDCARQLYQQGGIQNLYRGSTITVIRGVLALGVYFCAYDGLKRALVPQGQSTEKLNAWRTMFAGGMAGIFCWIVSMPADVIKTRLQSAPPDKYRNGARDVFRELWYKEGPSALFKGTIPILIRAFPANAACFLGYEVTMKALNHLY